MILTQRLAAATNTLKIVGATFVVFVTCFQASASNAQLAHWARCDTAYHGLTSYGRFTANISPYFLNEAIGFAYEYMIPTGSPRTHPRLFRTKDSARTWELCDTSNIDGGISSLWFTSTAHGYLSGTAVYETFDTGLSWRKLSAPGTIHRVLSAGRTLFVVGGFGPNQPTGFAGVFSGGLYLSTNNGTSWTWPTLVSGTRVVAYGLTVDGGNFVAVNYYRLDDTTWWVAASYDAGVTWKTYPMASQYAYVRNGTWTYSHPWCVRPPRALFCIVAWPPRIVRSLDISKGWDTILYSDTSFSFDDEFQGTGCTLYVASSALSSPPRTTAIQRTTDLGKSWHLIVAPRYNHIRDGLSEFCAAGNGATMYLFDDSGYIWKTTDGGDGALSASDWPNLSVAHLGAPKDTLITKLCDSAGFQFTLSNSGCLRYWLDSVAIDSIGPNGYYTVLHNRYIGDGQPSDTALVTILPKKSGTYPLTVHGRLHREDWLEIDTTFHLTLIINDNPGVLDLAAKPLYDFGVQSLCKPRVVVDSFSVSGHGCEAVTVDSIVFMPVSGSGFTFKKVKSFIASDTQHLFRISYKPTAAETDSGVILIYSFDGTSHHTDTLLARGAALADSRSFVIASDTLVTRMCDSVTATVTLQNPTCNQMKIDSISLPAGLTLLNGLPIMLDTGSTITLSVRVSPGAGTTPLHVGDTALPVKLHVIGTSSFDTTVMVHIHISRGIPALVLSTDVLNFDTVSTCSSKTLAVVIQSTGCDTLTCSGSVSAPSFKLTKPLLGALPVGATDTAWITFASQTPGLYYDTLLLQTNTGTKMVPIQGYAMADVVALEGGHLTAIIPPVIASCGGDTTNFGIPNLACSRIVVDSVVVPKPFAIISGVGDTVLAQDGWRSAISYIPVVAGADTCLIHVYYHGEDGIKHNATYWYSALAIAPPRLNLHLVYASISTSNQGHVTIPVSANASSEITGPDTVAFRLDMRTDLLTPLSVASSIAGAKAWTSQPDYSGVNVSVALPLGFTLSVDTVIAIVDCRTFVTDTMRTSIRLTEPTVVSQTTCLSIDSTSPAITFGLDPSCGDSLLTHFIGYKSFTIESIRPNPARDEIEVIIEGARRPEVELFDVLGHGVYPPILIQNGNTLVCDVSNFRDGVYYLRLTDDGCSQSRRIVINR